jgi:hypothetical protein
LTWTILFLLTASLRQYRRIAEIFLAALLTSMWLTVLVSLGVTRRASRLMIRRTMTSSSRERPRDPFGEARLRV